MKKLLLFIGCSLVLMVFQQCKKEENGCPDNLQPASIIGQDFRRCACCGGWFIEVGKDTMRTFTLPESFKIDPMPDLPIEICLSFEDETGPCRDFEGLIVVDQIMKK